MRTLVNLSEQFIGCLEQADFRVEPGGRGNEMPTSRNQPSFDELVDELVDQAIRSAQERLGAHATEVPQSPPETGSGKLATEPKPNGKGSA